MGAGLIPSDPKLFLDFGRISVVAFFLISGYVIPFSIPKGEMPKRIFWTARFFRLWPAYWVAILLAVLTNTSEIPITFRNVLVNCTMLQGFLGVPDMVGAFWTLQIELVFYGLITAMIAIHIVDRINHYVLIYYTMIAISLAMAAARG